MKIKQLFVILVGLTLGALSVQAQDVAERKNVAPSDRALHLIVDKMEKYTDKAEQALGKAVDFVMTEAEPVVKEFLVWRAWKHGLSFAIPVVFFFTFVTICLFSEKKADWYDGNIWAYACITTALFSLISLVAILFGLDNLFSFIQIQVAPRIYLIEEAAKLIK